MQTLTNMQTDDQRKSCDAFRDRRTRDLHPYLTPEKPKDLTGTEVGLAFSLVAHPVSCPLYEICHCP